MKSNRILLLAIVVLTIIVAFFIYTKNGGSVRGELKDFAVEDTASVDKLFLADKNGHTSLLERKASNKWTVNGKYVARQDAINTLLFTLKKMTVRSPVAKAMQDRVFTDLMGVAQRKLEIYSNGTLIKTIFVGLENMDKMGTYMMIDGSSVPFELHIQGHRGFLQTRFITDDRLWRDPSVFNYDYRDIRSINVKYNEVPTSSFEMRYDGKKPTLFQGNREIVPVDSLKCFEYLNSFRRITYEYMVTYETFPETRRDSILALGAFAEITVTDKDGKKNDVKCYHRMAGTQKYPDVTSPYDPDRMYAWINDKDFVLIQFVQFDKVLRNPVTFLPEP